MPKQIDLNLLPTLYSLLETKSVTQSANQLGISQPSVSRLLAKLRETFGDPLLIKSNSGMMLTARAGALLEPLQRWHNATRSLLRAQPGAEPTTFSGTYKVASTDYGVLTVLMPAMQHIMAAAPGIRIEVVPLSTTNLNDLTAGTVDIVVTGYDPEPGRAFERFLYVENYRCVLRPGHPALLSRPDEETGRPLSLDEFTLWPHVAAKVNDDDGDPVCRRLAELGRARRIVMRIPYFSAAPHLVLASDAIMVMPSRAADHFARTCGLRSVPAPIELDPFNYWLLWHERNRRDPVTQWLVQSMSDAFTPQEVPTE